MKRRLGDFGGSPLARRFPLVSEALTMEEIETAKESTTRKSFMLSKRGSKE